MTASPCPIPAAASASHSASVPDEHPRAWFTPKWPAAASLKTANLLAKNELLRLKHMAKCFKQFLLERLVLAFQVQHGYGLSFGGRIRRDCCVLHAKYFNSGSDSTVPLRCRRHR